MIKNKIKRVICLVLGLLMPMLVACSPAERSDDKLSILCTIYPQYDWVMQIIKGSDGVQAELMISNGADVHSYNPSVDDMVKIKQSDAVLLIGGEADAWVSEALEDAEGETLAIAELEGITFCGVSDEHIMSDHDEHGHHDHSASTLDEHIWLSIGNAKVSVEAICELICELDPDNAEIYRANTEEYVSELSELDAAFAKLSQYSTDEPVVFADRFPFVYLFEEYGISYVAAYKGCSADAEADFDTMLRLADRLADGEYEYIAVCDDSDKKLAKSVMSAAGVECEIVTFDSMQSVNDKKISDGYSYVGVMRANLEALSKILK